MIWALYTSPRCLSWDGVGEREALSGSCVGQNGWVDEEREGGNGCYDKGGGWVYFNTGGKVMCGTRGQCRSQRWSLILQGPHWGPSHVTESLLQPLSILCWHHWQFIHCSVWGWTYDPNHLSDLWITITRKKKPTLNWHLLTNAALMSYQTYWKYTYLQVVIITRTKDGNREPVIVENRFQIVQSIGIIRLRAYQFLLSMPACFADGCTLQNNGSTARASNETNSEKMGYFY